MCLSRCNRSGPSFRGICDDPKFIPRSWSDGPEERAFSRSMNALTAMESVGGLAKVGTWAWNSGGTYITSGELMSP
jgi:hypothetical protein